MSEVFYTLSLISLKISLGIFFLRIMVDKYQKRLIWGVMISSTLVGIMLCFTAIFQCGFPVKSEVYWQRRIADNCLSKPAILGFNYTHGLVNIVTDILLCLSPIPIIRMARLYSREKLVIYGIFIIATMLVHFELAHTFTDWLRGCIGSIVRIFQVWVLVVDFLEFWCEYSNLETCCICLLCLVYIERIAVWSTVEVGFGITAACLATLRPLLRNIKKGIKSYRSHSDPSTVTKWSSKLTTMFSTSDETNPKSTTSTKGGGRNMKAFFANTTKMDTTFQGNDDFENQWVSYNQTPELDFPLERYSVVTTITGGKDEIAHRLNQPLPPLPTYASPKRQSSIPMPSGSSWKTADALIYGFTPKIEKRATWFPVLMSPAPEREDDGLK